MRVLLIDDNRLMLEGLQNLLEAHGIQVAGLASDGRHGAALAQTLRPDVILMDIRMPDLDGLAATRLIKADWPEARIVILTTSADEQDLFEAVKSGASGYLLKSIDAETLIEALRQAQEGIPPFSPGLAAKLLEEFRHLGETARVNSEPAAKAESGPAKTAGTAAGLNSRQAEVLTLVAQGLSYKEAGARLHISPHTVRYHMAEIMNQLHIENRAQVLALAGHLGLGREDSKT
jgi:two-component system NarL family response regulator